MEKANRWLHELPAWIPICGSLIFAALWVGQHYQSITDRLDTLEHQMVDVQEYIRTAHQKTALEPPESEYNSHKNPQEDAGGAWRGR
jgi:hypothetical protein